jgi:CheY-like chemotaxis protein
MIRAKKFLLTDDDRDDREMFSEALASIAPDIVYHWAEDGQQALQLLASDDKPDVLFLDINMPVMNGWELLHKLKKDNNYNDIPVIIYTTSSEQRDKEIAKDLGALCFVTKPDNFRLMKSILKVVVDNLDKNSLEAVCADIENVLHKQ